MVLFQPRLLLLLAAGLIENKNKANTLCLSAYQMDLSDHNGVTKAKVYHLTACCLREVINGPLSTTGKPLSWSYLKKKVKSSWT